MLVNKAGKFRYPALVDDQGTKMRATIDQHRNKAQLIRFPLCAEERIAVFYVLQMAGIPLTVITNSLTPSIQTQQEIQRASQLLFAH